jgi:hypothetical protein
MPSNLVQMHNSFRPRTIHSSIRSMLICHWEVRVKASPILTSLGRVFLVWPWLRHNLVTRRLKPRTSHTVQSYVPLVHIFLKLQMIKSRQHKNAPNLFWHFKLIRICWLNASGRPSSTVMATVSVLAWRSESPTAGRNRSLWRMTFRPISPSVQKPWVVIIPAWWIGGRIRLYRASHLKRRQNRKCNKKDKKNKL